MLRTVRGTNEWQRRVEDFEGKIIEMVSGWDGIEGKKDLRHIVFTTRLMYIIRDLIKEFDLDVSWGHVFNESTEILGPECDIIIFRGKPRREWNGEENAPNIIRVVWVDPVDVQVIVEHTKKLKTHANNPNRLVDQDRLVRKIKNFTEFGITNDRLWLLAENIEYFDNKSEAAVKKLPVSYVGFGDYFYFHDKYIDKLNEEDLNRFFDQIIQLR